MIPYEVNRISQRSIMFKFKYDAENPEFHFLFQSDAHFDNPKCNRKLFFKHLEQAKERNALIFNFGDFFDAMQGKADKRGGKSDIRPEYLQGSYFNNLVNDAYTHLLHYKENLAFFSYGNHETSIVKYNEFDMLNSLHVLLRMQNERIQLAPYTGWVILHFEHSSGGRVRQYKVWYNHGFGGGGVVTKGTIQNYRVQNMIEGANMVVMGHVHESYKLSNMYETLDSNNQVSLKECVHLRLPTYKEEYCESGMGWHIERGAPPKPLGAWWLKVCPMRENEQTNDIYVESIEAR